MMAAKKDFIKYCDTIESMPWECDEKDCDQRWHLANYWINAISPSKVEYTEDEFGDGNHEPVDEIPEAEEVKTAWERYNRYVAETGKDPLGNFRVKHHIDKKQKWDFQMSRSITPKIYFLVKPSSKPWSSAQVPSAWGNDIAEFFTLTNEDTIQTLIDDANSGITWKAKKRWQRIGGSGEYRLVYGQVEIDRHLPRPEATIVKELKQAARAKK